MSTLSSVQQFDPMKVIVDSSPPLNAPLSAKYTRSFAYPSMKDRLPVIITKIIDYLVRDKKKIVSLLGEPANSEVKAIIGELSELKNHLQTAKPFEYFSSKEPDTELWNEHLKEKKEKFCDVNYYESDWLFAECYSYRRVREAFATKSLLSKYDPFSPQKTTVLKNSLPVIQTLFFRINQNRAFDEERVMSESEFSTTLNSLLRAALWANRLDLSLSAGSSTVDAKLLSEMDQWDSNILVNDISKVVSLISSKSLTVVDYVTDNGGVEVLADLILADFLVERCNVKTVNFRVKPIPWFVSDVTIPDFHFTIETLASSPDPILSFIGKRWQRHLDKNSWVVTAEPFWCTGYPYSDLHRVDPPLFTQLASSSLVIFKGDLNYRKLVRDMNWDLSTPLATAVGPEMSSISFVALRTCKADTVAGLDPNTIQAVVPLLPTNWMTTGEFAVVQYNESDSDACKCPCN